MSSNPFTSASDRAANAAESTRLEFARVVGAPNHTLGDDNKHVVKVKPMGQDTDVNAQLTTASHGDISVPTGDGSEFAFIAYQKGDIPIVLDLVYTAKDSVPAYDAGERRIGHPLSDANLFIDSNGVLTVSAKDGTTVKVANGTVTLASQATTTKPVARDGDDVVDGSGNVVGTINASTTNVESG